MLAVEDKQVAESNDGQLWHVYAQVVSHTLHKLVHRHGLHNHNLLDLPITIVNP